ncbi:golgin subfamily A member 6-like protein 7 [Amphiprion ocellaris]|uniref:golgin subfamily A member 6-like protein 7 n=1 Tax=Amphiprion ocellaris TaxID=80972 RepID=UPI0024115ED6|nr:golgin subfamily A member 6-like protein 7 [Amphiprion ocellaris]
MANRYNPKHRGGTTYCGPNQHYDNPAGPRSSRGASQEETDYLREHNHNMSIRIKELIAENQQYSFKMLSSKARIEHLQEILLEKEKELQDKRQQNEERTSVLEMQLREREQAEEPAENTIESEEQQDLEFSIEKMKTSMSWGDIMDDVDEMKEQLELKDGEILRLKKENRSLSAALRAAQNMQRDEDKSLEDNKELQEQKKVLDKERKAVRRDLKELEQKTKELQEEKIFLEKQQQEVLTNQKELQQRRQRSARREDLSGETARTTPDRPDRARAEEQTSERGKDLS